jgi:DNA-binding MarR family transcriptional regulator
MPDADLTKFNLRDFMPYIMARVGSLMAQSFTPHLERENISLAMWRVMMAVHFNGPLSLGEIARSTGVNVSTLSRLIGRMEKRALVSRDRSRRDSRAVHITLLPTGEEMFQVLWPEAARLEDIVTNGFSEAEVTRLKSALQDVEDILARLTEDRPDQS